MKHKSIVTVLPFGARKNGIIASIINKIVTAIESKNKHILQTLFLNYSGAKVGGFTDVITINDIAIICIEYQGMTQNIATILAAIQKRISTKMKTFVILGEKDYKNNESFSKKLQEINGITILNYENSKINNLSKHPKLRDEIAIELTLWMQKNLSK